MHGLSRRWQCVAIALAVCCFFVMRVKGVPCVVQSEEWYETDFNQRAPVDVCQFSTPSCPPCTMGSANGGDGQLVCTDLECCTYVMSDVQIATTVNIVPSTPPLTHNRVDAISMTENDAAALVEVRDVSGRIFSFEVTVGVDADYRWGFSPNWNGPTAPSRLFFEHNIATTTSRVFEALGSNMPDGTEDWSSVVVEYTDNAFSPLPTGAPVSVSYEISERCFTGWIERTPGAGYSRMFSISRLVGQSFHVPAFNDMALSFKGHAAMSMGTVYAAAQIGYGTASCSSHRTRVELAVFVSSPCASSQAFPANIRFTEVNTMAVVIDVSSPTFPGTGNRLGIFEFQTINPPAGTYMAEITVDMATKTIPYVEVLDEVVLTVTPKTSKPGCSDEISWCANDGNFTTSVVGGSGFGVQSNYDVFTYRITTGNPSGTLVYSGGNPNGLSEGLYRIVAHDCHDCADQSTHRYTKMPDPTIGVTRTCGADISLAVSQCHSGSFQFDWHTPDLGLPPTANSATGLAPGSYEVEIFDVTLGCGRNYTHVIEDFTFTGPFSFQDAPCLDVPFSMDINFIDQVTCNPTTDYTITVDFGDGSSPVVVSNNNVTLDTVSGSGVGQLVLQHDYPVRNGDYVVTVVWENTLPNSPYIQEFDVEVRFAPGDVLKPRPLDLADPGDKVVWVMYHRAVTEWVLDSSLLTRFTDVEVRISGQGRVGIATDPLERIYDHTTDSVDWYPHHLREGYYQHLTLLLPGRCVLNSPRTIYLRLPRKREIEEYGLDPDELLVDMDEEWDGVLEEDVAGSSTLDPQA